MKTAREWFEELKEPYRSQAIKYTGIASLRGKHKSCSLALSCSFEWALTDEGHDYWQKLYETL